MKEIFRKSYKTPARYIFLALLAILIIASGLIFYNSTNTRTTTVAGGIFGGFIVYTIGFLASLYEYKTIDKFRALGVKDILSNRKRKEYYEKFLKTASDFVRVTGTSCTRFIDDFGNKDSDDKTLIELMTNNPKLRVQILIPNDENTDTQSKLKIDLHKEKFQYLLKEFPNQFEIKRYDTHSTYSFVQVDDNLIVGPVFRGTESKESPAIHLDADSDYSQKYIKNFEELWSNSTPFR